MEATPETPHFGLTRISEGEQLSKNGFAFSDLDRITLDAVLFALANHQHDGGARLTSPDILPSLTALPTGGTLPSDTTFYYRVSYMDRWGLETAASDEASITTHPGIDSPTQPALEVESTSGSLVPGLYSYVITFVTDDGGETLPSPAADIRITEGNTNRLLLDLPDLPGAAAAIRIYRAKPGQTRFYLLQETDQDLAYDEGLIPEDQTVAAPTRNTTNTANAITVEIPEIPAGVFGWRIYRSVEPGVYDGFNLVHEVIEGTTETSSDLRTSWTDTGEVLSQGEPRSTNATIGGGASLDGSDYDWGGNEGGGGGSISNARLRGSRLWSTTLPGVLDDREYNRTIFPMALKPTAMSVFFATPPTLTGSELLRVRITDSQATPAIIEIPVGDVQSGEPFQVRTWPLRDTGSREAESGLRSAASPIVNDLTASNGQSVELPGDADWVDAEWGELEQGVYRPFVTLKVLEAQPATPATVRVDIIRTDSGVVLGSSTFVVPTANAWTEFEAQQFTAPGGVPIKFRVVKNDAISMAHYVDSMRFEAIVPELVPGPVSVAVLTENGPSDPGADAQVSLWF